MSQQFSRFSLRFLFLFVTAIAAFLAGQLSQTERVRLAQADSAQARNRTSDLEQLTQFWEGIALDNQLDLNTVTRIDQNMRVYADGSVTVTKWYEDRFRTHRRRWNLGFRPYAHGVNDEVAYARAMDRLGIKLAAIWHAPPRVCVVSGFSATVSQSNEIPDDSLIVNSEPLDHSLLKSAGLPAPAILVRLLPSELAAAMAANEIRYAKQKQLKLMDVKETSFRIVPNNNGTASVRLSGVTLRQPPILKGEMRCD